MRLWSVISGAALQAVAHPGDMANLFFGVAWSPDGRLLAGGGKDGASYIWAAAGGKFLHQLVLVRMNVILTYCRFYDPFGNRLQRCSPPLAE